MSIGGPEPSAARQGAESTSPRQEQRQRLRDYGRATADRRERSRRHVGALAKGGALADLDLASLGGRYGSPLHINLLTADTAFGEGLRVRRRDHDRLRSRQPTVARRVRVLRSLSCLLHQVWLCGNYTTDQHLPVETFFQALH